MPKPTFEELETKRKPSFEDLELKFFSGSPAPIADPNEIKKRSKEVLQISQDMGISVNQAEKNYEQYKIPPIFSMVPFGMPPDSRFDITDKAIKAAKQSIKRVNADQSIADAYLSGKDLTKLLKEKDLLEAEEPVSGGNFISDTFYKGIGVAAPMAQSLYEASPFAAMTTIGGAIIGGIAGNLIGGPAPEELITVPAGAKLGLAAGTAFGGKAGITAKSAEYWYRQGVGQMIYSMNKNGVDMKFAGPIAAVAGIPYAAIEFAQMSQLTPGLRQGVQNISTRSMLKAFTIAAKKYGQTYVTENIEEVLQEGIQIAAEDIGNLFEGNDLKFNKDGFIERANRLAATSVEAGQSMLLLPLPGAAIDIRTGVMEVKKKNQFIDAVEQKVGVPRKAAKLAADMIADGKSIQEVDQMLTLAKAELEPTVPGPEAELEPKVTKEEKARIVPPTMTKGRGTEIAPQKPTKAITKPEGKIIAQEGELTEKGRPTIVVPDKGLLVYEETEEGLKLQNIDVVESERRKGVGRAMVEKAEKITGKKFTDFSEVASPEGKAFVESIIEKPVTKKKVVKKPKIEKSVEIKRDILGGVDPLIQIHKALREAKAVRPVTEAKKKEAIRKRVGAAAGALRSNLKKGMPAEQAIQLSTGLLKSPLTEYDQLYESIEQSLDPDVKDAAYQQIARHPDLRYFEVVNTQKSFQKLLQGASITPNEAQQIERVFGKAFEEQLTKVTQKSDLYDRLITWWKAGLLTGIKTSGLNILSTAGHAVSETAKDVPAALIDSGLELVTGERTTAFALKGYGTGFKEGLDKGWKYMKTGYDDRNVGEKYDYKKTSYGTSKIAKGIQAITEFVFHLLGAEDQPWYYGAYSRSLRSQAIVQAKNKKLKGKEFKDFVNNLQKNPTDSMLIWATEDAKTAIFTNRTKLGDIAKDIQRTRPGELIVPFARTPSAVAMQIINYSPVGIVKEIAHQINQGEFSQRKISQAGGRSVVGTGALYLGTLLFKQGLISLGFPKSERERKLWELEGRKPNSIKIDGKWRDVQALGPVGNLLVIGGYFQQALDSKGSPTEAIVEAMAGGGKSFTEQTFVRGVNLAVDALTDPEASFDRWFTSMAGSVVPTIVADIARAQDDISRRAVGPRQRIQSRIPFYRKGLPPAIDVFGQDLPRYGGNVLETMADPTRPSKIRQDVVVDELRRLFDKGIKVSPTQLGDRKGYDVLTVEENTQLWQRSGELTYKALFNIVNSEEYKKADDFGKGRIIDLMVRESKASAKAEIVNIKLIQGVSIMKLAESGLLNIDSLEMLKYYRENE